MKSNLHNSQMQEQNEILYPILYCVSSLSYKRVRSRCSLAYFPTTTIVHTHSAAWSVILDCLSTHIDHTDQDIAFCLVDVSVYLFDQFILKNYVPFNIIFPDGRMEYDPPVDSTAFSFIHIMSSLNDLSWPGHNLNIHYVTATEDIRIPLLFPYGYSSSNANIICKSVQTNQQIEYVGSTNWGQHGHGWNGKVGYLQDRPIRHHFLNRNFENPNYPFRLSPTISRG